jgi:hypothetical protein
MIGEVTAQAKYAHNAVMVAIVLIAVGVALLRRRREPLVDSDDNGGPVGCAPPSARVG